MNDERAIQPANLPGEYHEAHLAFARAEIVQAAAEGKPILDLLLTYTADVVTAERNQPTRRP